MHAISAISAITFPVSLFFYHVFLIEYSFLPIFSHAVPQNSDKKVLCTSGRRWLRRRVRNSCRKKLLFKRIPILAWLPNYRKEYVVSDLVAGITVGLTVIPQAIAYANVAGLPLQVNSAKLSERRYENFDLGSHAINRRFQNQHLA